jgi:hypothetical protein
MTKSLKRNMTFKGAQKGFLKTQLHLLFAFPTFFLNYFLSSTIAFFRSETRDCAIRAFLSKYLNVLISTQPYASHKPMKKNRLMNAYIALLNPSCDYPSEKNMTIEFARKLSKG